MRFDPSQAQSRVERLWGLPAEFGLERDALSVYLNEIVSDRFALIKGLQVIRDELQLACPSQTHLTKDVMSCSADYALPSVCTTLAATSCGDRIHQGETASAYLRTVASRFAALSESGELKMEDFAPAGGGTDDGGTLAHVTVAHQLDLPIRDRLYEGNAQSFVLVAFDLRTHVGRLDFPEGRILIGRTQESYFREPRAACGAIVGTLTHYNADNPVHRRIRRDLGEANYLHLTGNKVETPCGVDCNYAVAAAIVSIQGMQNTAQALTTELDERGVGHLTAAVTVNRPEQPDTLLYVARATVFGGEIRSQGLGLDASKYSAEFIDSHGEKRLILRYCSFDADHLPFESRTYAVRPFTPEAAVVDDDPFSFIRTREAAGK